MLGGLSSGSLLLGSGAFSSARADRNVNVGVAEDDGAFVGYSSQDRTVPMDLTDDDRVLLVTVTNQFAEPVSVTTAKIVEGAEYVSLIEQDSDDVSPGNSVDICGEIDLESLPLGEAIDVSVTVEIEGTGVSADILGDTTTRQFSIERIGLRFNGSRRAEIIGPYKESNFELWFVDKNDSGFEKDKLRDGSLNGNDKIAPDDNSNLDDFRLLAVRFADSDVAFYRPDCGISHEDLPRDWDAAAFKAEENGNSSCNW